MVIGTYIEGVTQLSVLFLSVISGIIAISMFKDAKNIKGVKAWKYLIIALIFFAIEEIFGAIRSFGYYENPFITHIIPSFIMIFLIIGIMIQIISIKYEGAK